MSKQYRAVIIGFAHMHINHLAGLFGRHPQIEWAACADTSANANVGDAADAGSCAAAGGAKAARAASKGQLTAPHTRTWNRDNVMRTENISKLYGDWRKMLAEQKPDLAIVACENALHAEVAGECAGYGVHACVEKPMAVSLEDAKTMAVAAKKAGTVILVNWPIAWNAAFRTAKALLEQGAIGRPLQLRWRSGHRGPLGAGVTHAAVNQAADTMTDQQRGATWWHQKATGGGAMLDYCCNGSMAGAWLFNANAKCVMGMKSNLNSPWAEADDNAFMLIQFPQAVAVVEASWTTKHNGVENGPIVYGTDGTLVASTYKETVRIEGAGGRSGTVELAALPKGRATVAEEMVHHLDTGEELHPILTPELNLSSMAILDAGIQSAQNGVLQAVEAI